MTPVSRDPLLDAAAALADVSAADALGGWSPPGIPVSTGAIILDDAGDLLILKPTYKTGWTIPGGIMEADGESPWDACRREVLEETALVVETGRLVCVDTRPGTATRTLGLRLLFHCGVLTQQQKGSIRVQREEVSQFRFVPAEDAFALLRGPIRRRVRAGLAGSGCRYLENGRPVSGVR